MCMFNAQVFQNTVKKLQTEDALSILANVSKTEASISYLLDLNITNNTHVFPQFTLLGPHPLS